MYSRIKIFGIIYYMKRQELLTSPKKKVIIIRLHYIAFLRAHRKNGGIYK